MGEVINSHPNRRDKGQVEVLSGMGASKPFIADHLGLSMDQLDEYYSKELKTGAEEANLQVAKTFHELATSGEHPQMTVLWMKMRAGWSDGKSSSVEAEEDDDTIIEEAREKLLKLMNRGK
jgi:hypothetical protein